jgi:hypothetical protein
MKFFWKRGNVNKKTMEEHQRMFRRVFLSPDGQEILRILLNDWSFFDICDTEQKRVLNDYAKLFLHDHLGMSRVRVYTELDTENIEKEQSNVFS